MITGIEESILGSIMTRREFFLGLLTGCCLAGATYTASGHANEFMETAASASNALMSPNCQIRLGKRRLTNMPHCLEGEVVSGIMTTTYYCSKLILECPE